MKTISKEDMISFKDARPPLSRRFLLYFETVDEYYYYNSSFPISDKPFHIKKSSTDEICKEFPTHWIVLQ